MNALPCISHYADQYADVLGQEAARQAYIEMRTVQLSAEYRHDPDILWESLGNVTTRSEAREHPALIKALCYGGSDTEMVVAMRYLRGLVLAECDQRADSDADRMVQAEEGLWL